jgi:hypothetical protein
MCLNWDLETAVGSAGDMLEIRDMVLILSVRVMGLTAVDHI